VGDNLTAVVGDMEIPSGTTVNDVLVVKGKLRIGDNCRLFRKVKVLGDVSVGIGTVVEGDIVSGGSVVIGSSSVVGGSVKAAGRIEISKNVVIGKNLKENLDLPKDSFNLQAIVNLGKEEILV
jgi:UDP-3-O-[3-hydroxymyristoyl] glucosamine N-acyltransferase